MANKDRIPTRSIRISRFRRSRSRSRHLGLPNPTQTHTNAQKITPLLPNIAIYKPERAKKIAPWSIFGGGRGVELGGFDEGEGFGEGIRGRRRSRRRCRRVGRDGDEGLGGLHRLQRRRRCPRRRCPLLRRTGGGVVGHAWGERRRGVKWGVEE